MEQGIEQGRLLGEVSVYYTTLNYSPEKIAKETHQPVDVIEQVIRELREKK